MIGTFDTSYTYDDRGRVTTIHKATYDETTTITYTEAPQQLVVDMKTLDGEFETFPTYLWTLDYDDQGRITRLAAETGSPIEFAYGDDWFTERFDGTSTTNAYTTTATGQCTPPSITFAPSFDLPKWSAALTRPAYAPDYLLDIGIVVLGTP
jgi:YD repeat-containing protein